MNEQTTNSGNHTQLLSHRARILGVIVPLLFFSFFIASAIISISNDIYAFSKADTSVTLYLENPASLYSAARMLEENGIINNPAAFTLYVRSKGAEERIRGFSGELELNSSMSYREILRMFSKN